jgi:phage N-6-adenine-methyltransferase
MKTNETRALTATGKDDWLTPPAVLEALNAEFRFSLDAAASGPGPLGLRWLGPGGEAPDALECSWANHADVGGSVWLNPPYSRAAGRGHGIKTWHREANLQSLAHSLEVVVLCPPHPARGWFQKYAIHADEVRVFKSRIAFIDPETLTPVKGNTQDSCLVIYRPHVPVAGWAGGPRWSWIEVPK